MCHLRAARDGTEVASLITASAYLCAATSRLTASTVVIDKHLSMIECTYYTSYRHSDTHYQVKQKCIACWAIYSLLLNERVYTINHGSHWQHVGSNVHV